MRRPAAERSIALLLLLTILAHSGSAFPMVRVIIPNGFNVRYKGSPWFGVGHYSRFGAGPLNPFGADFYRFTLLWNTTFCNLDSDGDGFTNGEELGDPNCVFSQTKPASFVSDAWTLVSHPGFNDSTPLPAPNTITAGFAALFSGVDFGVQQGVSGGFMQWLSPANSSASACIGTTFGRYSCDLSAVGTSAFLMANLNYSTWPAGVERLKVENQSLTGGFSGPSISKLPILSISFRNNSLTGLPDLTALPSTLQSLDLSMNHFTGVLNLSSVTLPSSLTLLNLSGNPLSGVILDLNQAAATTKIVLPSLTTNATTKISCICGSNHAGVDFAAGWPVSSILGGTITPSNCAGCVLGLQYDLSTSQCQLLTAVTTLSSPIPAVAFAVEKNGFSAYCDDGCTAAFVVLILFLLVVVLVALFVKLRLRAESDTPSEENEPIVALETDPQSQTKRQEQTTTTTTTTVVVREERRAEEL